MSALAVVLGLGAGCERGASTPAPAPAKPAAAPEPAPKCNDWSGLDPATLAPLTDGPRVALLDQVWRRVLEKHYDPTLSCLDWPKLRLVYAQRVAEAKKPAEAYAHINAMLDELGHSHLELFPPARSEDTPGPAAPDLTVRWVEQQLVIVRSNAEGPQGPVLAGSSLLAINDRSVSPLVDEVRARTSAHDFPLEVARVVMARLSCERAGQTRKLKVTNPDKEHRPAVRVVPCVEPEGERVTLGNLRDVPTMVEHGVVSGTTIGRLAFNVWMLPMVKQVQAAMLDLRARGMTGLVLDLRGNPGGVGPMAIPVARMLLAEEGTLGTLRFRDFEQHFKVEPEVDAEAFDGPVVVLIDEGTASTSEIFVIGLRDLGRITVVGARPSAGKALPSVIEKMRDGALLQYVVADYHSPKGAVVEGTGIKPDLVVTETREAFAAGRDPVLDAALQHLQEVARGETRAPPSPASTKEGKADDDRAPPTRP